VESAREGSVCVIVPVYNEVDRIDDCLSALTTQNGAVREILVVDGGSTDGTQQSVERFSRCDPRIRLISASPISDTWNGKVWGLEIGLRASDPAVDWVVTVDADVRCGPSAIARVVSFAE
jgi:dolichol-phosphate mannosyltransferase